MPQIVMPSFSESRTKTRTYDTKSDPAQVISTLSALLCPTGTIISSLSPTEPNDGWKLLNGQSLFKFEYPALYAILAGNVAETTDTFTLPDLRGRMLIGIGGAPALAAFTLTGAHQITLNTNQLPAHAHTITDPGHDHTFTGVPHGHAVIDPGHLHTATTAVAAQSASGKTTAKPVAGDTGSAVTGISIDNATADGNIGARTTGITVEQTGNGDPVPILPPVIAINWMVRT